MNRQLISGNSLTTAGSVVYSKRWTRDLRSRVRVSTTTQPWASRSPAIASVSKKYNLASPKGTYAL